MSVALAMIVFGGLLIYMGIKGYSVREAVLGRKLTPSTKPPAASR